MALILLGNPNRPRWPAAAVATAAAKKRRRSRSGVSDMGMVASPQTVGMPVISGARSRGATFDAGRICRERDRQPIARWYQSGCLTKRLDWPHRGYGNVCPMATDANGRSRLDAQPRL